MRKPFLFSLSLLVASVLTGCMSVSADDTADTTTSSSYVPVRASNDPQVVKVGVMMKDASHFTRMTASAGNSANTANTTTTSAGTTTTSCPLVSEGEFQNFLAELRSYYTQVVAISDRSECTDCAAFVSVDATIQFGSVNGYSAQVVADFTGIDPKKKLASVSAYSRAAFDGANAGTIGMTLINGATLGILTPVTAPLGAQMQCSLMQTRSEQIFTNLVREVGNKIRADAGLTAKAIEAANGKTADAVKTDAKADVTAESKADTKAESAAPANTATQADVKADVKAETKSDSKADTASTVKPMSITEKYPQLIQLKDLLDKGILTQEEFDREKAKILGL